MSTTDAPTADSAAPAESIAQDLAESAQGDVTRYVIVEMNSSYYGIPTDSTIELMSSSVSALTPVPKSPGFVRGVINHRGSIIPVIDTRVLLGLPTADSQSQELVTMLRDREQDHISWLDALERAVRSGESFNKETDPTLCEFGRWYQETVSDERKMRLLMRYDATLRSALLDMDKPHRRIHRLADQLLAMRADDRTEAALEKLEHERSTTLAELRRLLDKVADAASSGFQSMLVITELGDRKAAFEVDAVHTVQDCAESDVDVLPETATGAEFMSGLVHQPDGGYVLICDLEQMYDQACPR